MPKGVEYEYQIRVFSEIGGFSLTANDEDCRAFIIQQEATITLQTIGNFDIKRKVGDPPGMPVDNVLPPTGVDPAQRPANPFRANDIGNPNSGLRMGASGGEPEINIPDPDHSLDPDASYDPDFD